MPKQSQTVAVYDIETPFITDKGIHNIDQIYCIGVVTLKDRKIISKKIYTQYWTPYSDGSLMQAITALNKADIRVAFNNIGFDDVVLRNALGVELTAKAEDLLIASKICFSKDDLFSIDAQLGLDKEYWGAYSLRAFGMRLGNDKMHFDEFDTGLTEEMCIYCIQDCVVTADLYLHLTGLEQWPLDNVRDIEHKAAAIIAEQTEFGFYLDIDKARELNTALLKEKGELARELSEIFHPKFLKDGQPKTYKKRSTVKKYLPNNKYMPLIGTKE